MLRHWHAVWQCPPRAGKDIELQRVKAERDELYAQQTASQDQIAQITAEKHAEVVQLRAALDSRESSAMSQGLQNRTDELEIAKSALQDELLQQKLQLKNLEFDLAHKDVAHKKDVEKLQARINDGEVRLVWVVTRSAGASICLQTGVHVLVVADLSCC
jgi:anthranilate/para-aminobenzoate synthase component I